MKGNSWEKNSVCFYEFCLTTFARSNYYKRDKKKRNCYKIILVDTVDMFWSICHGLDPMHGNLHTKNYETLSSPRGVGEVGPPFGPEYDMCRAEIIIC